MARHKRRHSRRRSYRGISGLGSFGKLFGGSVSAMDVLIGGVAAVGGIALVKYIMKKVYTTTPAPAMVTDYLPLFGAAAVGAVSYFVLPKVSPKLGSKKQGLLIGAAAAGIGSVALSMAAKNATLAPYLADYAGYMTNRRSQVRGMGVMDVRQNKALRAHSLAMSAMDSNADADVFA